jgi:hypothetical protein
VIKIQIVLIAKLLVGTVLVFISVFIIIAIVDRYWGYNLLGGYIKPRPILVYECRPWWVKGAGALVFIECMITISVTTIFWILVPEFLLELVNWYLSFTVMMIVAIFIALIGDRPKSNKFAQDKESEIC